MTGLGLALAVGAVIVVPLGLRLISPDRPQAGRLLRRATAGSLPSGLLVAVSLFLPVGWIAGALVTPWIALGSLTALAAIIDEARRGSLRIRDVHHADAAALGFVAVAPVFTLFDRIGMQPSGFDPIIVRLTAIHFVYAGFALPLVGAAAWRLRPRRSIELALGVVVLGIPLTALGFLGPPAASWIGALAVALGGVGIGWGAMVAAGRLGDPMRIWLLRSGGGALLISMPLAAAYATAQFVGLAGLDIPTMARLHGTLNVVGFALPSLAALSRRPMSRSAPHLVGVHR